MTTPRPTTKHGGNPADNLRKALDLITSRKYWTQYTSVEVKHPIFGKDYRTYCLIGAIGQAVADDPYERPQRELDILAEAIGLNSVRDIPDWNDSPSRKHGEVIEALDKAIRIAAERA